MNNDFLRDCYYQGGRTRWGVSQNLASTTAWVPSLAMIKQLTTLPTVLCFEKKSFWLFLAQISGGTLIVPVVTRVGIFQPLREITHVIQAQANQATGPNACRSVHKDSASSTS
jgi:hypothetical protein